MITRYSQLVMPQDANVVGTLFGGQMVSWMDIAAAVGLTAGFLALVMLLANRLPMYAHWELALKPRPRRR